MNYDELNRFTGSLTYSNPFFLFFLPWPNEEEGPWAWHMPPPQIRYWKGTKVKTQLSVLHSSFCIKEVFFLRAKNGRRQRETKEGRGPLINVFSTSTRIVKTIQISPTVVVLCSAG